MSIGRTSAPYCVLGAGLTGAVAALELAHSGVDVVLIDRDAVPFNRASLRNEGKIHLGFVYAHEDSLATVSLMLDGALSFAPILRRLLGSRWATVRTSTPFTYLVAGDSLLAPSELAARYAAIERRYLDRLAERPDADYLGDRPRSLFRALAHSEFPPCVRADGLAGAFWTAELAIDPRDLATAIRQALAETARIRFAPLHEVATVECSTSGYLVTGTNPDGPWQVAADRVVNALWDSRLRIDRSVGLEAPPGWVYRLKYRVVARVPVALHGGPSITMVQGPYGDVVIRPDGIAYFSWYPAGLQGWSYDLVPPDDWNAPCRGDAPAALARRVAVETLAAIDRWYPGAAASEVLQVDAGAIVAYGRSDVDDPGSGLHNRTRVGVTLRDGYCSIEPGKLTTAPMFAVAAARQLLGRDPAE